MSFGLLFSGQGAQRVGMGKSFYDNSGAAREVYDQADDVLGWSIKNVSFEGPEDKLTETKVCQPALFVMGYAIFAELKESGKLQTPAAALGLSLGEITALTAAGSFSFEDGLKVVARRGELMQEACDATSGAMASLIGGELAAAQELAEQFDVDIANLNCPGQIVISGETPKVNDAVSAGKQSGRFKMVVPLKVAGAYHSRLMRSARDGFADYLTGIEIKAPQVPVFSNTTGKEVKEPDEIRDALVKQVVSTVLWEDCMRSAAAMGVTEFFECGPGAVLAGMARRIDRSLKVVALQEHGDLA